MEALKFVVLFLRAWWTLWLKQAIQILMMLQLAIPLGLHQGGYFVEDWWKGISVAVFFIGFLWFIEA